MEPPLRALLFHDLFEFAVGNAMAAEKLDRDKEHLFRIVLALDADHQSVRVDGFIGDLFGEGTGSRKPNIQALRQNQKDYLMPKRISQLNLNLPFGLGGVTVEISQAEREAAWKLYVEFSTRISTQPLAPGTGSVREALASLHALFGITREILKDAGPGVGQSPDDLGPVAILVLNDGLRPFLTKWHIAYGDFELSAGLDMLKEHGLRSIPIELVDQAAWDEINAFYEELESVRKEMREFVHQLAMISGTEPHR